MQTFLPYRDFYSCARCLDNKRLANQVNEALVILRTLTGYYKSGGWKHHPAVKMWKGYEFFLLGYREECIRECKDRGILRNFADSPTKGLGYCNAPSFLGDERLHRSHQSNLLRKDPEWYGQFGWDVPNNLPYYWPVR